MVRLSYPRSVADAATKGEFARADCKLCGVDAVMSPNKEGHSGFRLSEVILEVFRPPRRALYLPWPSLKEGAKTCVCKHFKHTCPDFWSLSSETGSFENVANSGKQSGAVHPQTPSRALGPASPRGTHVKILAWRLGPGPALWVCGRWGPGAWLRGRGGAEVATPFRCCPSLLSPACCLQPAVPGLLSPACGCGGHNAGHSTGLTT